MAELVYAVQGRRLPYIHPMDDIGMDSGARCAVNGCLEFAVKWKRVK